MRSESVSLRQIAVLTVTGLLAPAADLLPGFLTRAAGRAGWLVPLLVLPAVLLWVWAVASLFNQEGRDLGGALKVGLGKGFGWSVILLYIMWGTALLGGGVARASSRLGEVYGDAAGMVLAGLVLLLALWMAWGKDAALCRAAELLWLAVGVAVAAVLLLSLFQIKGDRLVPAWEEWRGGPAAWTGCLGVVGSAVFGTALAGKAAREKKGRRRLLGWGTVLCVLTALLAAAVLGQVGAELAVKLEHPFLIMVQGLSVEGGFARLEAPVAALWLLADFAWMGLLLAAVKNLGGAKAGKWIAAGSAATALLGQKLFGGKTILVFGGLILGFALPVLLLPLVRWREKRG